ncbi:flavodoxin family protein [Pseudalkalibacillus salsuginis]|uniref:flavodoxin family protein n=1 Tax=Pseudalkalibacillus salsuginis TaxID=2910972 RepID=UPI001F1D9AE5|nr:flavodoxin family protein [Pseudalkalibacillus salsuginis]MCF6411444.1 flavodoxin family protein [Pseudalkalibacillus salsuginis]
MSSLHTLILNCSLKTEDNLSHTQVLTNYSLEILQDHNVSFEIVWLADYNISYSTNDDPPLDDNWPEIFEKVKAADIVIFATPLWIEEKSSIAAHVIERLYAESDNMIENGPALFYNKVGGVLITGNNYGAKQAAQSILHALSHIGFTIPPNGDSYCICKECETPVNEKAIKKMSNNLVYFAGLLKDYPIPAQENSLEQI